ncbi:MAG TPA: hypothetical protein VLA99_04065, partial [Nitrospiraceae bacterium]|nr:hypothetical protein [Nitrospiraceae bacterium]
MTTYARFNRWLLAILLAIFGLVILTNVVIDPYNIFQTSFLPIDLEGNLRFTKVEFLHEHRDQFNTFILGSSRAGVLSPTAVAQQIPGARAYNLSITAGTAREYLGLLRYLLDNQFTVKHVLVQIDLDYLSNRRNSIDYAFEPHPYTVDKSLLSAYWTYATIFPTNVLKEKITHNLKRNPHPVTIQYDSGVFVFWKAEQLIAEQGAAYFSSPPFLSRGIERDPYLDITHQVEALRAIAHLCLERRIDCVFFIPPHHHAVMDSLNEKGYQEALLKLGEIADYYDFSGYNRITLDSRNYYEPSHYRPFIGTMIVNRLYGESETGAQDSWG